MDLVQSNDSLNHHKAFDFVACANKPTNEEENIINLIQYQLT